MGLLEEDRSPAGGETPGRGLQGRPELGDLPEKVAGARRRSLQGLLSQQQQDGHWCAELEGDSILESEYILVMHYLGRSREERVRKAANHLRSLQLPEGGWGLYPGGGSDVSATAKAYFVLKLVGDDPEAPHMRRARRACLALGGLDACNSFTRLYLSIFGQYEWNRCPAVPPEMALLPGWLPFNLYEMSSWSRAIVVPLSVIWALKPSCPVPAGADVRELRRDDWSPPVETRPSRWFTFFQMVNAGLHMGEDLGVFRPLRQQALRRAEGWILQRLEKSDGLGAIFPPIINTIIALKALGYADDHPVLQSQVRELERLEIEEEESLRVQPCKSPVWDTALSLNSLLEAGMSGEDEAVARAAGWLLERESREPGDWRFKNPLCPTGGWYFEYANEFYPDCDDTAEVLLALGKVALPSRERQAQLDGAVQRGLGWLLAMQNRDGGWASFDRGCDQEYLTHIPFADHNAMIDPSTADITARVLEALAGLGLDASFPPAAAAVEYLRREQEADGSWYGRWGCNYIYGTFLALRGLEAIGEDMGRERYQRAADWLRSCQNPDGGWGELPISYEDPALKGRGPSTAAQTAWALMGLLATGDVAGGSVRAGLDFLLSTQKADGTWEDEHWTGTGFPKVFYLRYHLYAVYFPLLALATHERLTAVSQGSESKVA